MENETPATSRHLGTKAKEFVSATQSKVIPFAKKRPIVSGIIGLVVLLFFISLFTGGSDTESEMAFYTVDRGNFLVSIVEGGTLQAVNETTVRNEVDGNSRIIYIIPEGTYVKKGQLIVELDTEEAEKDLNEHLVRYEDDKADFQKSVTDVIITQSTVESDIRKAELDVQFARMDLEKFEQIEREQEIRNAQIEIITAEESLKLAEERLEWSEKLTEEGFETKSNLDRDKLAVTNQSLGLEKAQNVKRMLSEYDLAKMEAEYRSILEEAEKESSQYIGRKRGAMIDPDNPWKPMHTGHALEAKPSSAELLTGHGTTADHIVALQVFDRQGIATHAVSQKKPALEVDCPNMVRILCLSELGRLDWIGTCFAATDLDHAVALQDCPNRTARRWPLNAMLL